MKLSITLFAAMACHIISFAQADLTPTLVYPGDYFPVGSHKFDLLMKNNGPTVVPMNGYKIGWQLNNGPITEALPVAPTYGIASSIPPVRVRGNFVVTFSAAGTYQLKVWTRTLTLTDANHANDTLVKTIKVLPYVPNKNVLMEVFKHQACCPCLDAAAYEDSVVSLKANYAIANIYTPPTDVISNPDGKIVDDVWQFAHPAILFDRFTFPHTSDIERPVTSFNNTDLVDDMGERDRYYTPIQVSFHAATFNAGTRLLKVKLKAKAYDALSGDMRFNLYLTEDSVQAWQGCATPNANNYYHRHVLRHMFGGPWGQAGSIPAALTANQEVYYEFSYTLPANYNLGRLEMIGLVQRYDADSSKRVILNSEKMSFGNALTLGVAEATANNSDILVYPNPVTDKLTISNNSSKVQTAILNDVAGKRIFSRMLNPGNHTIDMSMLPPGNYELTIKSGNDHVKTMKLIKK